jgi:hypothetical protein
VSSTILGFDADVSFQYDGNGRTRFVVELVDGEDVGRIYFGNDVYPGPGVVDPNAALSMIAAIAHELGHFHRWRDHTELPLNQFTELDEALTSLDAVLRYPKLSDHDARALVRDALQRLQRHYLELVAEGEQAGDVTS